MDEFKTKVIFLWERPDKHSPRSVFAYFPELIERNMANGETQAMCYAHIGQHSVCHSSYARECKMASKKAYYELQKELESIGYNLEIL